MNGLGLCSVCGAKLKSKRITYTQPTGDAVTLVADVPAEVCPQCGEEYLSPDTVDAIQEIIERQREPEMVAVRLYHFPRIARQG